MSTMVMTWVWVVLFSQASSAIQLRSMVRQPCAVNAVSTSPLNVTEGKPAPVQLSLAVMPVVGGRSSLHSMVRSTGALSKVGAMVSMKVKTCSTCCVVAQAVSTKEYVSTT